MTKLFILLSALIGLNSALAVDRFYASTDRATMVLVNATAAKLEELTRNGRHGRVFVFIDSASRERLYLNLYLATRKDGSLVGIDSQGNCFSIDVSQLEVSRTKELGFLTSRCNYKVGVSPVVGVASTGDDTCYINVSGRGIAVFDFEQKKIREWLSGVKADSCFGLALWDGELYGVRPAPAPGSVLHVTTTEVVPVTQWRDVPVLTQEASLGAASGGNIYLFDAGRLRCLSDSSSERTAVAQTVTDRGLQDTFWQRSDGNSKDSGFAKDGFAKDGFSKDIPVPGEETAAPSGNRLPGLDGNIISFAPTGNVPLDYYAAYPAIPFGDYFLSGVGAGGFVSSFPSGSTSNAGSPGTPGQDSPGGPSDNDSPPWTEPSPTPPCTMPTPPCTMPTPPDTTPTPPDITPVPEAPQTTMLAIVFVSFGLYLAMRKFKPA
ncbi:MAG: hypothetical protein JO308_07240 [Verrucomicrobia bacterium]|nr:hypothetical protein [Verrucomicrobiota bacterium]